MSWSRLEAEAPGLARLGRERLAGGLALLGTVRADGSPRVSPIGVFFLGGELVIGVMTRSGKARDLRGDPRVALQSLVTAPDEGEPELKLYGLVAPSDARGGVGGRSTRGRRLCAAGRGGGRDRVEAPDLADGRSSLDARRRRDRERTDLPVDSRACSTESS